jgi:ribosomal protein S17E
MLWNKYILPKLTNDYNSNKHVFGKIDNIQIFQGFKGSKF